MFICVLGLTFAVWARHTLGTNWSADPVEIQESHELVTSGPYSWVRHPIYAGDILALIGTFLADGRLRVLILFVVVTIGMFIRSRMEDKLMAQQFPETYPEYKKRVKALIPRVF
jgi:protein-S-isoprenylcysteine O-methyltransferase Ste14